MRSAICLFVLAVAAIAIVNCAPAPIHKAKVNKEAIKNLATKIEQRKLAALKRSETSRPLASKLQLLSSNSQTSDFSDNYAPSALTLIGEFLSDGVVNGVATQLNSKNKKTDAEPLSYTAPKSKSPQTQQQPKQQQAKYAPVPVAQYTQIPYYDKPPQYIPPPPAPAPVPQPVAQYGQPAQPAQQSYQYVPAPAPAPAAPLFQPAQQQGYASAQQNFAPAQQSYGGVASVGYQQAPQGYNAAQAQAPAPAPVNYQPAPQKYAPAPAQSRYGPSKSKNAAPSKSKYVEEEEEDEEE
jgi:hypothetical protein